MLHVFLNEVTAFFDLLCLYPFFPLCGQNEITVPKCNNFLICQKIGHQLYICPMTNEKDTFIIGLEILWK